MPRKRRKEIIYSIGKLSSLIIERLEELKEEIRKNYLNFDEDTIDIMLSKVDRHIDRERGTE